jgi:predicted anti-sigma-YlaC factor YlaD
MFESSEHITCREVVETVTEYFDGTLAAEHAELFEQHLNFCEGCDWYVDQMRTTAETVGRVREEDIPPEARERLLSAFRDWKRS